MDPCGSNGKMWMLWSDEIPYVYVSITDDDVNVLLYEVPDFRKQPPTSTANIQRFSADRLRSHGG